MSPMCLASPTPPLRHSYASPTHLASLNVSHILGTHLLYVSRVSHTHVKSLIRASGWDSCARVEEVTFIPRKTIKRVS